jgi:hypothetical protein
VRSGRLTGGGWTEETTRPPSLPCAVDEKLPGRRSRVKVYWSLAASWSIINSGGIGQGDLDTDRPSRFRPGLCSSLRALLGAPGGRLVSALSVGSRIDAYRRFLVGRPNMNELFSFSSVIFFYKF